jgi:hypothetical protein
MWDAATAEATGDATSEQNSGEKLQESILCTRAFWELQKHAPRTMLGIVASRGSARQPTSYNHEHAKKILRIIGATRPSLARRATGFTKSHPVIHTRFL